MSEVDHQADHFIRVGSQLQLGDGILDFPHPIVRVALGGLTLSLLTTTRQHDGKAFNDLLVSALGLRTTPRTEANIAFSGALIAGRPLRKSGTSSAKRLARAYEG